MPPRLTFGIALALIPASALASDQMGGLYVLLIWAGIFLAAITLPGWLIVHVFTRRIQSARLRWALRLMAPILIVVLTIAAVWALLVAQ